VPDLSRHRPNVGVVLFHPDGRVWLGQRSDRREPHGWQFPQGGVDGDEDLYEAARRELAEETGVTSVSLLGRTTEWLAYDFPPEAKRHRDGWEGQKQIWFALRFEGDEAEIRLNAQDPPEFSAWRWAALEEAQALIVPFKRHVYVEVARAFAVFVGRACVGVKDGAGPRL
jgi:putative (di)nucleoside polyphosphate hydrolase